MLSRAAWGVVASPVRMSIVLHSNARSVTLHLFLASVVHTRAYATAIFTASAYVGVEIRPEPRRKISDKPGLRTP